MLLFCFFKLSLGVGKREARYQEMQLFQVLLKAVFNQCLLHVANLSGRCCLDGLVMECFALVTEGRHRFVRLVFLIDARWGLSLASRSDTQLRCE